ncbi:MAG: hypothetical protein RQM92_14780 [Candidatus Syntrophopropionicum ammoniitolerans]
MADYLPWIWQTLIMGNYGKTALTSKQPFAGIWYTIVAWLAGIVMFILIIGFLGIWWKPFSLGLLFLPKTAEEVYLAIEGWEVANFFALPVIMAQIPFVSLFQKWPFAAPQNNLPRVGAYSSLVHWLWFWYGWPLLCQASGN